MAEFQDEFLIRVLADSYSGAATRLDTRLMASYWIADGKLEALGNPEVSGRENIEKVFEMTLTRLDFVHQTCSGGLIKVDGDHATGRWSVTEFTRKNQGKLGIFLGYYDDDYVRTPDGWRFAKRVLTQKARARFEGDIEMTRGRPTR